MSASMYTEKVHINIVKINENAIAPTYALPGCAGLDLYSTEVVKIPPGGRSIIRTGIKMEMPEGTYGRIAPRSGLAVKSGIHIGAGVIDPSYRGEIGVVVFNLGSEMFCAYRGLRIAQIVIEKYYDAVLSVVSKLSRTDREEEGFGSTGETDKC